MTDASTTTLRRATRADTAGVTACVCAAYQRWIPVIGRQPAPMLEDYGEVIDRRDVRVAERDGAIVGVLVLEWSGAEPFIDNVAVDPIVAGTGVGRRLLELAESEARRHGHGGITLSTNERMADNLVLYERIGYVAFEHRTVGAYRRVFMRKALR
jgi:GNAT superfamily N-acetyltransferase